MDRGRTNTRQYSEHSDFFSTQREREYDQYTDLPQRESTQVRRGGRDGSCKPDSGLGYTQDYRTRWTHDNWVDPDSFIQRTEQPAGRKRGMGGRPAVDRIPEEMVATETVGGISHGSVHCLRPTSRIVRCLVVTLRRATQICRRR